jgi:hypothetical protein
MLASLVIPCVLAICADMPSEFPQVPGWSCTPESTVYTPSNLWDLIDGAADLFLEYRFEDLHLARYVASSGIEVRVELYRHATANDAFGMYAAERSTDYTFITIGTQGYRAEGIVNLFCGEYYVKLSTMDTVPAAQGALGEIGNQVVAHLRRSCEWPRELGRLPVQGRVANSETFVRRGLLGHAFLVDAFSAGYKGGAKCFVIRSGSEAEADSIIRKYRAVVKDSVEARPDGTLELKDPHNGTVLLRRIGVDLAGVYGSEDRAARESLLTSAIGALSGR